MAAPGLPAWAKDAAVMVESGSGSLREDVLKQKGYSSKQLKQMIHGAHPIFGRSGRFLLPTPLGKKVMAIARGELVAGGRAPVSEVSVDT
jgi:hypothetical protein